MSGPDLIAISPLITLTGVILVVMMVIAFARNLKLTCFFTILGLVATLLNLVLIAGNDPMQVTPLLIVDAYALLFSGIIVLAGLFISLLAYSYLAHRGEKQDEFYLLLMLSTLGGVTLAHSTHFGSLILGLELVGVSLYTMISYPVRGLVSLEAALKYLILSGVSSGIILFGTALLFAATGTLAFDDLAQADISMANSTTFVLVGMTFLFSGMAFKLSLVPFHMWTPDVYEGAPAPAAAFLATASKGGIFAVLLRFFLSFDGFRFDALIEILTWIAILSIVIGNLLALMQDGIKRVLAYSSIAHFGYLLVAFIATSVVSGTHLAVEASIFFLIAYFITTIGAFGVIIIMSTYTAADHDVDAREDYAGLFWRRPLLATFFTVMLLSLAGIPLTMGFVGKFYIFAAGVESELWALLTAVVVGSGLGLFYYLRIIFAMTRQVEMRDGLTVPVLGGWALGVLSLLLIILGVYPTPVVQWVSSVASVMG